MSQFQSDDFQQSRRVSVQSEAPAKPRGAGAFFVSVLFFVPFAPLVGFFCGLAARNANARNNAGSSLAAAAIAAGLLLTGVQGYVGYRGFEYYQQITAGPGAALTAAFRGDSSGVACRFTAGAPAGAAAPDFVQELRSRFGGFMGATLEGPLTTASLDAPRTYKLSFTKGTVRAEAVVALDTSLSASFLTSRLEYIRIEDAARGDLVFPAGSATQLASHPDVR